MLARFTRRVRLIAFTPTSTADYCRRHFSGCTLRHIRAAASMNYTPLYANTRHSFSRHDAIDVIDARLSMAMYSNNAYSSLYAVFRLHARKYYFSIVVSFLPGPR